MSDQLIQLDKLINEAGFLTRMMILLSSIALGIVLSQLVFARLRKFASTLTNGYYQLTQRALRGMPVLWGILLGGYFALLVLPVPTKIQLFLETLFNALGILSLTIIGARLLSGLLAQKVQKTAVNFASTSILVTTIELIVYATGLLFLLQSFGIPIAPLLTALGVGGLAVALALQDTLSNLFSGINILLSKQIKIGDFIKLSSGEEGTVVDMNWRNTTIRQLADNMIVVPNKRIASTILTNFAQPYSECSIVIPVGVSCESDMSQVERITVAVAKEVLADTAGGIGSFEPLIRITGFSQSGINFNVILRVGSITDQPLIQHEFIKRLLARYQQEGIKIPFLTNTVMLRQASSQEEPDPKPASFESKNA